MTEYDFYKKHPFLSRFFTPEQWETFSECAICLLAGGWFTILVIYLVHLVVD